MAEMHRDGQTEGQVTAVYLHHWKAEADSPLGNLYNRTLARQELVDHVEDLGLCEVNLHDHRDTDSDTMDEAGMEQLERLIDIIPRRAEGTSRYGVLKRRGKRFDSSLSSVQSGIIVWFPGLDGGKTDRD